MSAQATALLERFLTRIGSGELVFPSFAVEPLSPRAPEEAGITFEIRRRTFLVPRDGAPAGPFETAGEFAERCLVETAVDVRVYRREGCPITVVVPARYARALDDVRALRVESSEADLEWLATRVARTAHPLGRRVLPEDAFALLGCLPSPLIESLILWPEANPLDPFLRQLQGETFRSGSDVAGRDVSFYARDLGADLLQEIHRPWARLCREDDAACDRRFRWAAQVKRHGIFLDGSAREPEENWIRHLGMLLSPRGSDTWFLANMAPVRALVLGHALGRQLGRVRTAERAPHHEVFARRVELLEAEILPIVRRLLAGAVDGATSEADRGAAAGLLRDLDAGKGAT